MSHATFRFYAELNDLIAPERRFRDSDYAFTGAPSVKDAVEALGVPHGEVDLVLLDGSPAGFAFSTGRRARSRPGKYSPSAEPAASVVTSPSHPLNSPAT